MDDCRKDTDKLIPIVDQLYADEANAYIPILSMWQFAIDKLYGEDIDSVLKATRRYITETMQEKKKSQ
jgi:hypothetical protein